MAIRRYLAPRVWIVAFSLLLAAIAGCESGDPVPVESTPNQNPGPGAGANFIEKRALQDAAATAKPWQPKPELLGLLTDQKLAVGPYFMRVPNGYTAGVLNPPTSPGATAKSGVLLGSPRSDASVPQIIWMHITPDPGQQTRYIDELVDRQIKAISALQTEFVAEPAEIGRIADLGFARFRWKGVSKRGGLASRGIVYVCWDGSAILQFTSQAPDTDQAALDAAETTILSLSRS